MNTNELKTAQQVRSKRQMLATLEAELADLQSNPENFGKKEIERFLKTLGSAAWGRPQPTKEKCLAEAATVAEKLAKTISEINEFLAANPLNAEQEAEAAQSGVNTWAQKQTHKMMGY